MLVDLKPTGPHYMEDLFAAGGLGAVLRELAPALHLDATSVTGETLGKRLESEPDWVDRSVVRPLAEPVFEVGGLVALFGSLAPGGAILKRSAADARLFEHEGRAVVFASLEDLAARIDDPDLEVTPEDVLVLQNAGPKSGTGMPEAGYLPIPAKLARSGVKDMIRISDARMSGTAFGTIVLHVTPEAALGGPLGVVQSGDRIRLSVRERRLDLMIGEEELGRRRAALPPAPPSPERGYARLYHRPCAARGPRLRFRFPACIADLRCVAASPSSYVVLGSDPSTHSAGPGGRARGRQQGYRASELTINSQLDQLEPADRSALRGLDVFGEEDARARLSLRQSLK